jgi:rod shape-determining protein MreD
MLQLALNEKRLSLIFGICLLLTLSMPSLYPAARLSFFSPFLIIACYQKKLSICLWMAFLCGSLLDLLSSQSRLGLYALTFCITLLLLYNQKRNFFADSLTTLPIMSFLFASLSSLIMALLLYVVETKGVFSWHWLLTDVLFMPAADAFYAFCLFTFPAVLFGKRRRRGKDYFFNS